MSSLRTPPNPKLLVFQLALLIAMTPFAIDTYLPAFPQMAENFGVTIQQMGQTISTYLLGFSLGQLLGGPLSDRYGRKRIGAGGLIVFALCSTQIILSSSLHDIMFWRFFQAIGGGFSSVVVGAIVRDNYQGKESARMFATMGMIVMVAPMLAPAVGSLLLQFTHWQGIFVFLMLYAGFLLVMLLVYIPVSASKPSDGRSLISYIGGSYRQVFKQTRGHPHLLSQAFCSGVLFTFVTNAAHIFIEYFQVSPTRFPLFFGTIIATTMVLSRLNLRLLHTYSSLTILLLGCGLQLSGCLLLVIYTVFFTPTLTVVWVLLIAIVGSVGLVYGNNMSLYMDYHPHVSGSANAIFGCSTFVFGAVAGSISSLLPADNLMPMTLIMGGCCLLGCLVLWPAIRHQRETREAGRA